LVGYHVPHGYAIWENDSSGSKAMEALLFACPYSAIDEKGY